MTTFQQDLSAGHYLTLLLVALIAAAAAWALVSSLSAIRRNSRQPVRTVSGVLATLALLTVGLAVSILVSVGTQSGHPEFGGRPPVADTATVVNEWCEDQPEGVPCLFTDESGLRVRDESGEPLSLPACVTEDQESPCVWWANQRGNGEGESFAVVGPTSALPGEPIPSDWIAELQRDEVIPGAAERDWTTCRIEYGDTSVITCPDGLRIES